MDSKVNLNEYIHPKMDLLFVALNAPVNSNNNAHWFSNNLSFWNLLYNTGIITAPIFNKLEGDIKIFGSNESNYKNWSIGVTDLNRRDVETNSNNVKILPTDVRRILRIIDSNQVDRVCLMHSHVGKAFRDYGNAIRFKTNRYGQIGTLNKTKIYEVPFHSAMIKNKTSYYKLLIEQD